MHPKRLGSLKLEEVAALHMLGLLTAEEATAFEAACQAGKAEHRDLRAKAGEIAAALVASLNPVSPPPSLREKLMERVRLSRAEDSAPKLGAVLASAGEWLETGVAGVTYKKLYFDKESGLLTMLVRMQPGARYPAHLHKRAEQCLILAGDLCHPDREYAAGDFTYAETGSIDPELYTFAGNLLLIVGAPANEPVHV